jgi:hypothetical protein
MTRLQLQIMTNSGEMPNPNRRSLSGNSGVHDYLRSGDV